MDKLDIKFKDGPPFFEFALNFDDVPDNDEEVKELKKKEAKSQRNIIQLKRDAKKI